MGPRALAAQDPLEGLGQYIAESMADWDLPGLAVAAVYEDRVIFAQGFGVKELGNDDPVDARTLFQIGSTTKAFAAAAIGALVDDGLVDWDDPVIQHLPWFRLQDPWITAHVTIRDLLSHRSGMPAHAFPALTLFDAREVAERGSLLDGQGPFRSEYRYSNQAYGIAGLVVEAVTGMSWGAWVEERLFGPLGMGDSSASPYEVWEDPFVAPTFLGTAPAGQVGIEDAPGVNVAMPHGMDRDGNRRVISWQSYDNLQAAGNIVSSAADMANWIRMHLAGGTFEGTQVLGDTTLEEILAPQIHTPGYFMFADEGYDTYGLGWTRQEFQGRTYVSHGGGIFGFPAYVAMLPELRAGVVVLANGSLWTPYYPHQEIAAWVFARLLGVEGRDWHGEAMARTEAILQQVDRALAARDASRVPDTDPSVALDAFVGTYESDVAGPLTVSLADSGLRLAFPGSGAFSGDLEHWHFDTFMLHYDGGDGQAWANSFATFQIGATGNVTGLDLARLGEYSRTR
ncbi:MAG: serine hydrolase [Gemmatimonadetes bacterium]|nr:serine hydrolase [Gemmatimonadota bacterium]